MSTTVFLALIIAWVMWGVASLVLSGPLSLMIGAALGFLIVFAFRESFPVMGLMALLEPIGIILPLLILRQASGALGWDWPAFSTEELLIFLLFYVAFLATAFGVIPLEAYRIGYAPGPVAVMVLALCLYGFLSGNWFVPLTAVAAQAMWVAGAGSSNWFDHILHVALVPVVVVVLITRLVS
jgi:hypothetical protein